MTEEQIKRLESKLSEFAAAMDAAGYDCDIDDAIEHVINELQNEIDMGR